MSEASDKIVADLKPAIAEAAASAAGPDGNTMSGAQVRQMAKEVGDVVINQTNQEPWYQSNVTLGSLLSIIGGSYQLAYEIAMTGPPEPANFIALMTPIVGGAWALYGRWMARKPLGA